MEKQTNFDKLGIQQLTSDEEKSVNGGGIAHFAGWVVGGMICGTKCAANWLGISAPGKW